MANWMRFIVYDEYKRVLQIPTSNIYMGYCYILCVVFSANNEKTLKNEFLRCLKKIMEEKNIT